MHSPNNSFQILIDDEVVTEGSLLEDFHPSVNPAKEIDDPNDSKPETWVDEAEIADPTAVKPEDWDDNQPFQIVDETVCSFNCVTVETTILIEHVLGRHA